MLPHGKCSYQVSGQPFANGNLKGTAWWEMYHCNRNNSYRKSLHWRERSSIQMEKKFRIYIKSQLDETTSAFSFGTNAVIVLITSWSKTTSNRWGFMEFSTLGSAYILTPLPSAKPNSCSMLGFTSSSKHSVWGCCWHQHCREPAKLQLHLTSHCKIHLHCAKPKCFLSARAVRFQCFLHTDSTSVYHHSAP